MKSISPNSWTSRNKLLWRILLVGWNQIRIRTNYHWSALILIDFNRETHEVRNVEEETRLEAVGQEIQNDTRSGECQNNITKFSAEEKNNKTKETWVNYMSQKNVETDERLFSFSISIFGKRKIWWKLWWRSFGCNWNIWNEMSDVLGHGGTITESYGFNAFWICLGALRHTIERYGKLRRSSKRVFFWFPSEEQRSRPFIKSQKIS